jgi:hypothetical protein
MNRYLSIVLALALGAAVTPAQAGDLVIPAGETVSVRLVDAIDSKQTAANERFRASVESPLVVGRIVAVPKGTDCTVQVTAVESGKEVGVTLFDMTVDGRTYQVVSSYAFAEASGPGKTKKGVRRGVGLGALGAGIGAIAGGGAGAAIGAASGAGLGAISGAAAKGKHLYLPAESILSFQLRAPITLE